MEAKELLKKYYGYDKLRDEQEEIIDSVLKGKDTIGILPTGYGKSITFQIPALMLEGVTLVITPLIALMQDQVINLKRRGVSAECINSLLDSYEMDRIYRRLRENKIKILYVSAERLESKRFVNEICNVKISLLVCDEAHTLLWSEDFRQALGHIPVFLELLAYKLPKLALTATATNNTVEKISKLIKIENPNIVIGNCDRDNIFYKVIKSNNKLNDLIAYLSHHEDEMGIIYCVTIRSAKRVYEYLKEMGYKVGIYHGALDSIEKEEMQKAYTTNELKIMVCTNAFGMGIDIPHIRYVIEYDMPLSIEDLSQQLGRASRDGNYAEGIILFNISDIKTANYFIEHLENAEKTDKELKRIKRDRYNKLDKVINFCITKRCLHQYMVNYFNQKHNGKCKMCSNCKK